MAAMPNRASDAISASRKAAKRYATVLRNVKVVPSERVARSVKALQGQESPRLANPWLANRAREGRVPISRQVLEAPFTIQFHYTCKHGLGSFQGRASF